MVQLSVIDQCHSSGRNTDYEDIPDSPEYLTENSNLALSRDISFATSDVVKSAKSRFNARMDLMGRNGASVLPSERSEEVTPISNAGDEAFVMDEGVLVDEIGDSPLMKDPLSMFDDDDDDNDDDEEEEMKACSEKSNSTNQQTPLASKTPFESMCLKERTLTDLSQVGPLPTFMARDNTTRNFDDVSTDSAFDSAVSYSEYDASHFSEKMTLSHVDHTSSKHSQVSSENNMFDVETVSHLEYEGESDLGIDLNMTSDLETNLLHGSESFKRMKNIETKFNLDLETINSMSVQSMAHVESGKMITPRSSTFTNTPRALPTVTPRTASSKTNAPPTNTATLSNIVTAKPPIAPKGQSLQKELKTGR